MPNSQNFDQASNSTAAKLLEVDSELAVQEAELLSQLESVQEKRRSLKTVISLFATADTPATAAIGEPAQTPPAETNGKLELVSEDLAAPSLETLRTPATADLEPEATLDTQSNGAKKKDSSPTSGNKTTKVTRSTKAAKRTSGWQDYVREEFGNASLPEAVALVLQRQADKALEIPAIVKAIFVDELPREAGNKARRQVTNILSNGVRKNKWYRGQLGQYSMSKAAAKAKAA